MQKCSLTLTVAALALATPPLLAQDRLKSMPGYARYQEVGKNIQASFKSGSLSVKWRSEERRVGKECRL